MTNRISGACVPFLAMLSCLLLFSSCKENPAENTSIVLDEPYPWTLSSPQAQGLDSVLLQTAIGECRTRPYIRSLLVARNGYLVVETYNSQYGKYSDGDVASVSKGFISALVGIVVAHRMIDSVGQKMLDFFPEYATPNLDPRKHDITVEHLLTMRAGFDFDESQDHSAEYNAGTNWIQTTINLPLRNNPGEAFIYATPVTHLLSGIVTKVSGMSTKAFAERYLFSGLGISVGQWQTDPQGYYLGGNSMHFYPRDLARFGYLYLNNGSIGTTEILTSGWVRESLTPHDSMSRVWGEFTSVKYAYQWWVAMWNSEDIFLAMGYGGQFIIGVPGLRMIVVVTADQQCTPSESDERVLSIIHIVATDVLSAAM